MTSNAEFGKMQLDELLRPRTMEEAQRHEMSLEMRHQFRENLDDPVPEIRELAAEALVEETHADRNDFARGTAPEHLPKHLPFIDRHDVTWTPGGGAENVWNRVMETHYTDFNGDGDVQPEEQQICLRGEGELTREIGQTAEYGQALSDIQIGSPTSMTPDEASPGLQACFDRQTGNLTDSGTFDLVAPGSDTIGHFAVDVVPHHLYTPGDEYYHYDQADEGFTPLAYPGLGAWSFDELSDAWQTQVDQPFEDHSIYPAAEPQGGIADLGTSYVDHSASQPGLPSMDDGWFDQGAAGGMDEESAGSTGGE